MLVLELVSAGLIFLVLIACTIIPYCILVSKGSRDSKTSFSLSISNCVACGIFLSTCFLGLIPHVRHQEMVIARSKNGTNAGESHDGLALSTEAVVLLGFLLILLIEQFLAICSSAPSKKSSPKHTPNFRALLESDTEDFHPLVDTTMDHDDDGMQDIIFRSSSPSGERIEAPVGHSHSIPMEDGLTARTLFLLLGLSIHSVFEGVALGVQRERADFVNILIAVMFHEILCCFAYGVSMAQQRTPVRSALTTTVILSASIPAGMVVAVVVDQFETTNSMLLRYILEGLAAGTFVYVACVEMLSSELGHQHGHSHEHDHNHDHSHSYCTPLVKALSVTAGVAIFWGLKLLLASSHG